MMVKQIVKHLISLLLPLTILVIVPYLISGKVSIRLNLISVMGMILIIIGLLIMTLTIWQFIRIGKGTLAPWSPCQKMVLTGLYGYVRNPMIIGVLIVLLGESMACMSWRILIWCGFFFLLNNFYFIYSEEPVLIKRFGNDYQEYKNSVHRWIPHLKAFRPATIKKTPDYSPDSIN